jgi:hypothetical protein
MTGLVRQATPAPARGQRPVRLVARNPLLAWQQRLDLQFQLLQIDYISPSFTHSLFPLVTLPPSE